MSQNIEFLSEKAGSLPLTPGVYIMRDADGKVIYVGKSRALKNRVSQYFRPGSNHNYKTKMMVSRVRNFDYILTDTENEALTLESQLIKQYNPKYNIKLKDGKNAPYVRITVNNEYPVIDVAYSRKNDGAKYFGPYSSISSAYAVVRTVQKSFGVHSCKREFPRDIGRERPCLYYQIGDCIGPCTGDVSSGEYKELYRQILLFLRGSFTEVKKELTAKMLKASDDFMFETAAVYRDRIDALSKVWQRHKIVGSPDSEHDVFALYSDDACACLAVFYIREGRIIESDNFLFTSEELVGMSDLSSFLCDFYAKRGDVPKEILLSFDLGEEEKVLSDFVNNIAEKKVNIRVPERGELKKLCDMVYENAERHALQYREGKEAENTMLVKLASLLRLEVVPDRIEAYDISNYGHEHITAGMVTAFEGRFKKSEYRLFKMRTLQGKQDDYASMCEAIERRFMRAKNGDAGFSSLPDLILLDGGKGHVSAVKAKLRELGTDIPVFGMVKDDYHKTRTLCDETDEISIAKEKQVFMFIYKLQEEVHRFTISKMRSSKEKTLKKSSLEEIDGIGKTKAKNLLSHFKGLAGVKNAGREELLAVKGISQANADSILRYFEKENKK